MCATQMNFSKTLVHFNSSLQWFTYMCNVYMHDTGCSFELDATCCLECVMMAFTSYMYSWYELLVFKLSLAAIGEGLGSVMCT